MVELEKYTYEYLLKDALSRVPDTLDKREGSIIYDALAPACYALAEFYMSLGQAYDNTFIDTAWGSYLDRKVAERGLTRNSATYAQRRVDFTDQNGQAKEVDIGTRIATISSSQQLIYSVSAKYQVDNKDIAGAFIATCETSGTIGNTYTGSMSSVSNISDLGSITMSTLLTPAQDEETDTELRERYRASIVYARYGGNRQEYINDWVLPIEGVGACQVYPVWNGGGTVKVSIIDTNFNPCTNDFISTVKETLDPTNYEGEGVGLAPIGHTVTVVTPTEVTCNVELSITLRGDVPQTTVEAQINQKLQTVVNGLREAWGDLTNNEYSVILYQSVVILNVMQVDGVVSVQSIKINGSANDLVFTETATEQQLPKLGTVTINV